MGELPLDDVDPSKANRLQSCPVWLVYRDPVVAEIFSLHMHWEKGQLHMYYPRGAPVAVLRAIEAIEYGIRRGDRDKWEREHPKKEVAPPNP